jgi:hypothetical protein
VSLILTRRAIKIPSAQRALRGLPPRPCRQRRQNTVRRVAQKPRRAVAPGEVRPAGVDAPELEAAAGIGKRPRLELERPAGAAVAVPPDEPHPHAQVPVGLAVLVRAPAGVPPAQAQVLPARRAFADEEGIARAVADVRGADLGIEVEHAVVLRRPRAVDAHERGETMHPVHRVFDGIAQPVVGRATEYGHRVRLRRVRRVVQEVAVLLVGRLRLRPQRRLLQVRQESGVPIEEGPRFLLVVPGRAGGEVPVGGVVRLPRDRELPKIIQTHGPRRRGADLLHPRQRQGREHSDDGEGGEEFEESKR